MLIRLLLGSTAGKFDQKYRALKQSSFSYYNGSFGQTDHAIKEFPMIPRFPAL